MPHRDPYRKTSFLQRHLILTLTLTCVLVFVGFGIGFFTVQLSMEKRLQTSGTTLLFARLLERFSAYAPPEDVFEKFSEKDPELSPYLFLLLDENGQLIASANRSTQGAPRLLEGIQNHLPADVLKPERLGDDFRFSPSFPAIVKLNTNPTRYLVVNQKQRSGPQKNTMNIVMGVVTISALLAIMVSFTVLLVYMRKNARDIEGVISSIRSGDLKARFQIRKLDEVGQLMTKFNEMADEIEKLVERIRKNEKIRVNILQELGHDFRTPLASLKNSLETLHSQEKKPTHEQTKKLFSLAIKEVEYLSPLVDNLLFLANMEDPRFEKRMEPIPFSDFLSDTVSAFRDKVSHTQSPPRTIHLKDDLPTGFTYTGNQFLLERLVRNVLDNSLKYSRKEIKIHSWSENSLFSLLFTDDGPGFPEEVLLSFGERKFSRKMSDDSNGGEISLGLGSVIIKAISTFHRGTLKASNLSRDENRTSGASLLIQFKI